MLAAPVLTRKIFARNSASAAQIVSLRQIFRRPNLRSKKISLICKNIHFRSEQVSWLPVQSPMQYQAVPVFPGSS